MDQIAGVLNAIVIAFVWGNAIFSVLMLVIYFFSRKKSHHIWGILLGLISIVISSLILWDAYSEILPPTFTYKITWYIPLILGVISVLTLLITRQKKPQIDQ